MPPVASKCLSLDIPERQILVWFEEDVGCPWHHRLLMVRIEGAKWIVVTPTMDIQVADLNEAEDVVPVERDSEIPKSCRPVFSFEPLEAAELENLRFQCRRYADVLGVVSETSEADKDMSWVFSDPSHELFSEVVPASMMAGGRAFVRGATALIQTDLSKPTVFTVAERVKGLDRDEWLSDKRAGAGRDPRLNSVTVGGDQKVLLADVLTSMRKVEMKGWPFKGPPAIKEVLEAIRATGMEPPAYCVHYLTTCGLNPHSPPPRSSGI